RIGSFAIRPMLVSALLLATGNLVGKFAGVINQLILSSHFGAGAAMDGYFAVLAMPVFATGVVSSTLTNGVIPASVGVKEIAGVGRAHDLFRSILTMTLATTVGLCIVSVIGGGAILHLTAPGLGREQQAVAYILIPYLYPLFALNTLIAVITSAINAEGT